MYMFHVSTPHNSNCPSIPSTQLFIVDPNSKISTNILWINVMLPGKMGHQVVVCHLISFTVRGSRVWRREMTSEAVYCTCVTRRSFPRKHQCITARRAPLFLLDRVTPAAGSCPHTTHCAVLRSSYKITLYSPLNIPSFVTHAELGSLSQVI